MLNEALRGQLDKLRAAYDKHGPWRHHTLVGWFNIS